MNGLIGHGIISKLYYIFTLIILFFIFSWNVYLNNDISYDLNILFRLVFDANFKISNLDIRKNLWLTASDTVPILDSLFYYLKGLNYQLTKKIRKYMKCLKCIRESPTNN